MQTISATNDFGYALPQTAPGQSRIALTPHIQAPGFVMAFSRNEEIFGEEEEADFVYRVVSGVVRTVRILPDGRRQVGAFLMAGDVFGLEPGDVHRFSAEAVTPCEVALVRRTAVEKTVAADAAAGRELWAHAARDLARLQDHMLLLSRKSASERVGAFLLETAERVGGRDMVELAMSRTDIADYLGLTIETVSRAFSQFERDRAIALPSARRVVLRDRAALAALDS